MEVYIIRHTTVNVAQGTCYGQTDVPLADSFEQEAEDLIKKLPHDFNIVFSSPLQRCVQLASKFQGEVVFDDRLKEMHFGEWESAQWNDIPTDIIQPWYDDFVNTSTPQGESFHDLYMRTSLFIDELRDKSYNKVLIVTHGGIIRSLWTYLLQYPMENAFKIPVGFGEVFQFHLGSQPKDDYIVKKQ